ncbi:FAD-dependent oxidoreductase [Coxiella burnetii]|uniref:Pyridine nucleotide-disulfide oxidoreductase family n=1 Tax=Coxiella burnetii (strain RSA 493 / Nine Mile phase I) TaxID=227377 RepID=Q83DV6_COXBU|nr:FAD-dependent oxidoreductase [Coxiella burnetii]NP_819616.1 pyridine nucleotide-disulfide oxidoreductase family protein [Coxiella burnetii RSA 493]AAO90130.1 pyridine nucleotide-disulfide oxidoreductase family [Coxiella burnetii RSA 493]ACJ18714.1 pyridine nucleotide-disulfide oxidoreductase family [Coxiella burnetii CbuG_Q212]ARI65457.1 pyridine nucleotide-disulfide oxidoreductase [Coxiella burnetii]ARK26937.1 pyridine nucleotide-disulfide oxidoreductase [Coxiella burnetii]ATN67093.1 pyri
MDAMTSSSLSLKGFSFSELFTVDGLSKLDSTFLEFLKAANAVLHARLLRYRKRDPLSPQELSELLIECGPHVEAFLADLFSIKEAVKQLQTATLKESPIFAFKKFYVLREARRALKKAGEVDNFASLDRWVTEQLVERGLETEDRELAIATWGQQLLKDPKANAEPIEGLTSWCVAAMSQQAGQAAVKDWVSFGLHKHLNYENLVETHPVPEDPFGRMEGPRESRRHRDGFRLTDPRMDRREALAHVHYCIYCHKTDGDFCSKGFPVKKSDPSQGLKINPLGETLTGCPLDEKISEMHALKKKGFGIAALAVVMIDNPLCPATGHRICNDCMKACIYQKQEPVNIPQAETRILTDVLDLPWGVEIYDLMTRWNPLRQEQYVPKPYNGKKVLIMGMGPAGFTLAHYLLMEGFAVVGADGLKIEPLSRELVLQPLRSYEELRERLDNRVMAGFGGVAEYGITVRWDKNFLKLIYVSLLRRPRFQVFGSIRFGGTLLVEDAWRLGFDHLALAVGAGLPRELQIPNSLAPGMRQANDFLMALQLTGAAKPSSLANLQVRLPAVVIGGGLTAIDTATEVQAYYIAQVEKTARRYEKAVQFFGEDSVRARFDSVSLEILDEFLQHGQAVINERCRAQKEGRPVNFIPLLRQWGGVTVAYRRTMQESPAYKRNHEEVIKALEEGIYYAEGLDPKAVKIDTHGWATALVCRWRVMDEEGVWMVTDEEQTLPARSIFVATGAKPNIAYVYEHKGTFLREGFDYQRFEFANNQLQPLKGEIEHCKSENFGPFTSYEEKEHRVSFLGDTHPVFHGSVVKAIASAKRAFPKIVKALEHNHRFNGDQKEYESFREQMNALFQAEVVDVRRHTPDMVECRIRAPMAARNFRAGQFYRLQNYECLSPLIADTRLQTEALAMIGVNESAEADVISFIVLERGGSSRLVATLKPGQPISIMGPTGCYAKIPEGNSKTIMIVGSSMAAAHLRSLGPALRKAGHRVFYVALIEKAEELYCQEELEAASDSILWVSEKDEHVDLHRPQDKAMQGELISALRNYTLEKPAIPLESVDQVYVIGPASLLRGIQKAREGLLKEYFKPKTEFIASVYGPMQCMMKGVCAQCLQWQIDPATGKRTKAVYACSWQHQPMELIDIKNIDERLLQNRTQEILSDVWLDYLFATESIERV